jgi:hypothetical protein
MSATLQLTRDVGIAAFELRRGPFEISVDGNPVGSITNHDTAEIQVELGRHTLVVCKGRYSNRTLTFDVADGEVVKFRCNGARIWPTYIASIHRQTRPRDQPASGMSIPGSRPTSGHLSVA